MAARRSEMATARRAAGPAIARLLIQRAARSLIVDVGCEKAAWNDACMLQIIADHAHA
jgi:hypothetical protein